MDRPSLKISQTFIDFVKPVMPPVDENTTEEQLRTFFELGFMVWNAVLLDSVNKNDYSKKYLEELLSQNPGFDMFIMPLIERRKTLFANDKRMIGNFTVTYKDGNLNVRAEARAVPKPKRKKQMIRKFKIGDTVKVKDGTKDPDFGIDIGGWHGQIAEIEDHLVLIDLDSITLSQIPDKYFAKCEKEGLDFERIYLGLDDVEPGNRRDTEDDLLEIRKEIEEKHQLGLFRGLWKNSN